MIEGDGDFNPKRHSLPAAPGAGQNKHIEGMKLVDLDNEEEDRDRDGVKILMQKYNKLFKFLFNKYALSSVQYQKIQKFEQYNDKLINVAELCKLLRDHDLLASLTQTSIMTQVVTTSEMASAY